MSPRTVAAVVGVSFFLAGLLIALVPTAADAPSGRAVPCGNSLGGGFDEVGVRAESPALVGICGRLRSERLAWAAPVTGVGLVVVVGSLLVRRGSSGGAAA
ncbi:hypothetical protein [Saccharothrix australiensis]|uniref:Uncharacterized protein n=1 Tax=Saccharothrix australiensis TaxID=2072 RepID=A0A495VWF5_9PSEU|nr:hypothetical protein [Saccharothrix australiensis]RKT53250.1 hypothetical protein C8E97_1809 [Saccharothrix australiensis]